MSSLINNFEQFHFTYKVANKQISHPVYWREGRAPNGEIGPAVLILHEQPGMTERCLQLAQRISDEGFTVYLPLLFGKPGTSSSLASILMRLPFGMLHLCIMREFYLLAAHQSSPVTDWLRALSRFIYAEKLNHHQYFGVGVIGMCLTGGFGLSLMIDKSDLNAEDTSPVKAPIICQPALPYFALNQERKEAFGVSCWELERAREQAQKLSEETGRPQSVLAVHFEEDTICPKERFGALKRIFGDLLQTEEISQEERERSGIPASFLAPPHAVLTESFADKGSNPFVVQGGDPYRYRGSDQPLSEAEIAQLPGTQRSLERILSFLKDQLMRPS